MHSTKTDICLAVQILADSLNIRKVVISLNWNYCTLCPRNCHANRSGNLVPSKGICGETKTIRLARAALHFWEEPCISGEQGSGTVFFSGCTLRCVFCQNHSIANGTVGKEVSIEQFSKILLNLQQKGANNINLVTPTHFVPQIAKGIMLARNEGLHLPIVYNTSGYETVETLKLLDGIVDIYLPDLKYKSALLSKKYSFADDYFSIACKALDEMYRQVGEPTFDEHGIMKKGMIVRHLLLPGCIKDSKAVISYLYHRFGDHIYISIMNQYTPMPAISLRYPELNRTVSDEEYEEVVDYAIDLGVENGFIQEGETADESFIPSFNYEGLDL